jgi:hypothetical protein
MGNLNINIGGPQDHAQQSISFNVTQHAGECPQEQGPGQSAAGCDPLRLWREKLKYLQQQEAIATGAAERFQLMKQIEEARVKIDELSRNEG